MKENKKKLTFAAINPFVTSNIILPTEEEARNKGFVTWGTDNKYPNYLWDLYLNCATLQSIINGTADFIVGNDVICNARGFESTLFK